MDLSLSTNPEQAVDHHALQSLKAIAGDDPAFLCEMIALFLEQAPNQLARIRAASALGDARGVREAAHRMKSSSFYLGARRLSALCAQIETFARDGNTNAVTDSITALMDEFSMVQRALCLEGV